jgi:hypothetical protein
MGQIGILTCMDILTILFCFYNLALAIFEASQIPGLVNPNLSVIALDPRSE